jgi:hypothetical protein
MGVALAVLFYAIVIIKKVLKKNAKKMGVALALLFYACCFNVQTILQESSKIILTEPDLTRSTAICKRRFVNGGKKAVVVKNALKTVVKGRWWVKRKGGGRRW